MLLTFINQESLQKYNFESLNIEKLIIPECYGISEWYGGNVQYVAKIKDSVLMPIISKDLKTIDIAVRIQDLEQVNVSDLRDIIKKKSIKMRHNASKEDMINAIREHY